MISFNISAIDIILGITIAILAVLYLKKTQELFPEKLSYKSISKDVKKQTINSGFQNENSETFSIFETSDELFYNDLIQEESL
jgi:hypothetical protein